MGIVRKRSLDQLINIQKMMNSVKGGDIGEIATDRIEDLYDSKNDTSVDSEAVFDMSNEIQHSGKDPDWNYITREGQGNLGENLGDLTDQEFANNYWQHNPLNSSIIDTYEEFDLQYNFASSWKRNLTPKGKLKKVDESVQYKETTHIKRFNEM